MKRVDYHFPHIGTKRGGRARSALYAREVEGKSYTARQIAERLGVSIAVARSRIERGPFPLTWSGLGVVSRSAK